MKSKRKISSGWKEYFNFSSREKKGAFYLMVIITIQLMIILIMRMYPPELEKAEEKEFLQILHQLQIDSVTSSYSPNEKKQVFQLQRFDPNAAPDSVLLNAGLRRYQIRIIRNFLSKGGKFRVKNDLAKIRSIDSLTYARIAPYLDLPDSLAKRSYAKRVNAEVVELSTADSAQLVELKGIGPALASRIVKYRNALGGFISVEQLKEVYGITDSLYQVVSTQITLDTLLPVRKINLNTDSLSVLTAHPYLRYKLSYGIVNYRKQHGRINSFTELSGLRFVPPEIIPKIAPYLNF